VLSVRVAILAFLILAAGMMDPLAVLADAIHYAGKPSELSISTVSERTALIVLAPLDYRARPRTPPPSRILV
jgi:hypothetical protein